MSLTPREYNELKKQIKRNYKSNVKNRNNVSAKDTVYGTELHLAETAKAENKAAKKAAKEEKKASK